MQRRLDAAAIVGLLLLLGGIFARSWLAWGDFDVDYGREMYVPLRLAQGDVLYRDVRYPYGPFSPYLHALGYWLWKPDLGVLYASGMLATTATVLVLYAIARRIMTTGGAFLATVLVVVDVTCIPGAFGGFSYVFPYAYPALHGLLFLLVAVTGALGILMGGGRTSAAVTGIGIGLALLTKPEFGAAAVGLGVFVSILLFLARHERARAHVVALAASAVGVAAGGYGLLALYVSPSTVLTRGLFAPEYVASSGPIFALIAGFRANSTWQEKVATLAATWSASAAVYGYLVVIAVSAGLLVAAMRGLVRAPRFSGVSAAQVLGSVVGVVGMVWLVPAPPPPLPRVWGYPAVAAALPRYGLMPILLLAVIVVDAVSLVVDRWRARPIMATSLGRLTVAMVAFVLLLRIPAKLVPGNYANFYLPLGIILSVHLLVDTLPRGLARVGVPYEASRAAAITMISMQMIAIGIVRYQAWGRRDTAVHTRRGTLVTASQDAWATAYRNVLDWLEREASDDATLVAIPRAASLQFLSGHGNRNYEVSLVGVIPDAAAETAYVQALERDPPTLMVTSDQAQFEYGRGRWGIQDNLKIAGWVRAHYTPVHVAGQLTIWRRNEQSAAVPHSE